MSAEPFQLQSRKLVKTKYPQIYKRGGSYVVRITDKRTKKEHKISRPTPAELQDIQAEVRLDPSALDKYIHAKRIPGAPAASSTSPLVKDYADRWLRTYRGRTKDRVRPDTLREYRADLTNHILPLIGGLRLDELDTPGIIHMVGQLERKRYHPRGDKTKPLKRLSPVTIRKVCRPLHAMLETAREQGLIEANPASGVRTQTGGRTNPLEVEDELGDRPGKALTDDELATLIEATPEEWRYIPVFLARTGLRASEFAALRWKMIDLNNGRVEILERRRATGTAKPKSVRSRRTVPLSDETVEMLREIKEARLAAGPEDYLALSPRGKPIRYSNFMRRQWNPVAVRAGVEWAGLHSLRHTCATNLLRKGATIEQVSKWLGHADPAFTARVYTHLETADLPDASLLD